MSSPEALGILILGASKLARLKVELWSDAPPGEAPVVGEVVPDDPLSRKTYRILSSVKAALKAIQSLLAPHHPAQPMLEAKVAGMSSRVGSGGGGGGGGSGSSSGSGSGTGKCTGSLTEGSRGGGGGDNVSGPNVTLGLPLPVPNLTGLEGSDMMMPLASNGRGRAGSVDSNVNF